MGTSKTFALALWAVFTLALGIIGFMPAAFVFGFGMHSTVSDQEFNIFLLVVAACTLIASAIVSAIPAILSLFLFQRGADFFKCDVTLRGACLLGVGASLFTLVAPILVFEIVSSAYSFNPELGLLPAVVTLIASFVATPFLAPFVGNRFSG